MTTRTMLDLAIVLEVLDRVDVRLLSVDHAQALAADIAADPRMRLVAYSVSGGVASVVIEPAPVILGELLDEDARTTRILTRPA